MSNEGKSVGAILAEKKASIKSAPMPRGLPGWEEVDSMVWEEVIFRARRNEPGFRELRKLLSDKRFNK
jgi:hypothetical protein